MQLRMEINSKIKIEIIYLLLPVLCPFCFTVFLLSKSISLVQLRRAVDLHRFQKKSDALEDFPRRSF